MSDRPKLSALIIARDEAKNLPGCLATLGWVDEVVVVVDPASRDETLAIARRKADKVRVRPFDNFAAQRNAALAMASGRWVFAIDADERATPALAAEVRRVIAERGGLHVGYRLPIRSEILGRRFGYSGTHDDRPLRLFRKGLGRWVGSVHETVDLRGSAGILGEPLRHRTIPNMKVFLRKLDYYTSLAARESLGRGEPVRQSDLILRPFWTFAKLYLGKQGFRDGPEGFVFCAMSGVSVAVRHWKHRELVRADAQRRAA
ncbi:glycosyltransferase family 2 protein [soil metagenome]